MAKPNWLADLHPKDRAWAARWVDEVGERFFMAIAAVAVASTSRKNSRPTEDNSALIREAIILWLTEPDIPDSRIPGAAAKRLKDNPPTARVGHMEVAGLRRILSDGFRNMNTNDTLDALRHAKRRKLPIRRFFAQRPTANRAKAGQSATEAGNSSFGFGEDVARASRPPKPAMSAEAADRTRRLGLVLEALDGVIDPATPVSRVAEAFDTLIKQLPTPPDT